VYYPNVEWFEFKDNPLAIYFISFLVVQF